LLPFAGVQADVRLARKSVVNFELQLGRRRLRPRVLADCEERKSHHRPPRHRMPHAHVSSIAGRVRSLYIALMTVVAVGGAPVRAPAQTPCPASAEGAFCADDEDPCTTDLCADGVCGHVPVPNRVTCDPVLDAYRRTLGLGVLVRDVIQELADAPLAASPRALVDEGLASVATDLDRASDALAGRLAVPPPAAGETLAQSRSRAALGIVRATPLRVRTVLRTVRTPGARAAIGDTAADMARRVRFLYRSTNQLKRELRRLQRVSGVFAR